MKKILVVNGEKYWRELLTEFIVESKNIQNSTWILKDNQLIVIDDKGPFYPDLILWRLGAIPPSEKQVTALNLIRLSSIPCINSAESLLKGYDRLSMLAGLRELDLPVIKFNVVTKSTQLKNIQMSFPFVVKVGNYHGGFGKVLIKDERKWQDVKDLLFVTNDYITIEPFIDYSRDIRYLLIEEDVWAMSRKGKFWKANVGTTEYEEIELDELHVSQIKKLRDYTGSDMLAIDILENKSGKKYIVEYNDIPGLSGFSDTLKYKVVDLINKKMKK